MKEGSAFTRRMQLLVFPCKRCGAPVDASAKAHLLGAGGSVRIALDCACGACGHRALYQTPVTADTSVSPRYK